MLNSLTALVVYFLTYYTLYSAVYCHLHYAGIVSLVGGVMENCGVVEKDGEMAGKSAAEVPVSEQRTGDEAECKYAHTHLHF